MLAASVVVLGLAVTLSSGTWIVGVPELVRSTLGLGAGSFSLVAAAYAFGSICAGAALARFPVRRKARASMLAWALYLPAYALFAVAGSLPVALAAGLLCGVGQGSSWVLINSAAQEEVPDRFLGRVMGLVSLVHRGAHATGLLLVSPLFALAAAQDVFAAAAIAIPLTGLGRARVQRSSNRSSSTRDESKPSILSIAPAAAAAAPAGIRPTSSAPTTVAPRKSASCSTRATMSCSAAASQSSTFMLTWTRPALGSSSPRARTPGKPPPVSRTSAATSRAASSPPLRLTLNAISGRRAPTRTAPADSCEALGAEVRLQLARVDPALKLLRAAAPEERGPATRCELPVQEDRQTEIADRFAGPVPLRSSRARGMSSREIGTTGNDIGGPDAWMCSFVLAQVDPVSRAGDSGNEGVHEIGLLADEGEHRAVVIDVRVDVE